MTNKRTLLISLATYFISTCASNASAQGNVYEIDAQIKDARRAIERLRECRDKSVHRTLFRNPDYRYVTERRAEIDSLRRANEELVNRACDVVRRNSAPKFVLVARNPMVFMLYSSKYREVGSLRSLYEFNYSQIKIYEQRRARIERLELRVKNHHDSIMHAGIDKYQMMIDSLLNEKMKLLR